MCLMVPGMSITYLHPLRSQNSSTNGRTRRLSAVAGRDRYPIDFRASSDGQSVLTGIKKKMRLRLAGLHAVARLSSNTFDLPEGGAASLAGVAVCEESSTRSGS